MWTFEHTESTTATPAQLWARYVEPTTWPEWDRDIAKVTVGGPMAVGVKGSLKPVNGPATPFTFTEVEPERGFVDVSRLPLARMTFEHRIVPTLDGGCRFTHRVTISGLLSPLFARVIGRNVSAGLPTAMRALARLAERASASA